MDGVFPLTAVIWKIVDKVYLDGVACSKECGVLTLDVLSDSQDHYFVSAPGLLEIRGVHDWNLMA